MIVDVEALRTTEVGCLAQAQNHTQLEEWAGLYCDIIWDGLFCWPRTPAGTLITVACPEAPQPHDTHLTTARTSEAEEEVASKMCGDNGQWFVHEGYGNPWTNYTMCSALFPLEDPATDSPPVTHLLDETELYKRWVPVVKAVSQLGYGVSLVTLVAAICVLAFNRRLRCARNSLHLHLFTSFLLRASITLLKDHLFVQGVSLAAEVNLKEGGMHFSGVILLLPGLPGLFLAPWVVVRAQLEDTLCWTTHYNKNLFLLIRVPIVGSILLSFALFLNIVRVLLLKLRTFGPGRVAHRNFRYSRWARSTLVLVPLFGSHYALFLGMSYYMGVNQTVEIVWLFCDQLFASFQGCCVSLLYCLLNIEVRAEISRKWRSWRQRHHHPRAGSLSSTAGGLTSQYGQRLSANYNMNSIQLSLQTLGPTMISAPCVDTRL